MRFRNRSHAGRHLASKLSEYEGQPGLLILALPRGGVPVAYEVAALLKAPLDVIVVRKIGLPGFREFALGAMALGGVEYLQPDLIDRFRVSEAALREVIEEEREELARQEERFRDGRPPPEIEGKTVFLVDDGLATGSTMRAALEAVRQRRPAQVIVAVPVGSRETCREFQQLADHAVCAYVPQFFEAVGQWYDDFSPCSDEEVTRLLRRAAAFVPQR